MLPVIRACGVSMDPSFRGSWNETIGGRARVPLRQLEISPFWFELVLAASGASNQGVWSVYGRVFSCRFKWNRRLCPTSAAGDNAVLVLAASRASDYGCVRCLWMPLFMVVPMTPSAATSDLCGQRYCCLLTPASLFLPRGLEFCRKNRPLSSQQLNADVNIAGVVDTCDKIVPRCRWYRSGITKKPKIIADVVDTADKLSSAKISMNFWKKLEALLMGYSGAQGTLIYEINLKLKISCQTHFNLDEMNEGERTFITLLKWASS